MSATAIAGILALPSAAGTLRTHPRVAREEQRPTPRKPERKRRQPHVWPDGTGTKADAERATDYRIARRAPAGRASTLKKTAKAWRIAGAAPKHGRA